MGQNIIILGIWLILIFVSLNSLFCETFAILPDNFNDYDAGKEWNPYLISNLANLRWLSETPEVWGTINGVQEKQYFLQTEDIDASETINWNNGEGFLPIGRRISPNYGVFHGQYDGAKHHITKLWIQPHDHDFIQSDLITSHYSLFAYLWEATLMNLGLEDLNYFADTSFLNRGSTISSLVGFAFRSTITHCYATGNITVQFSPFPIEDPILYNQVGGLAFILSSSSLLNSYSKVNITMVGNSFASLCGGLVMGLYASTIRNSFYYGQISSESEYQKSCLVITGNNKSIIENCFITSDSTINYDYALAYSLNNAQIIFSFWDKEATSMNYPVEIMTDSMLYSCYGYLTDEMKDMVSYPNWDFENVWNIDPLINNGYPFLRNLNYPPVIEYDPLIPSLPPILLGNYPNPFNPSTTIVFRLATESQVNINIFNIKGQKVKILLNEKMTSGIYHLIWNGKDDHEQDLGSGVYFYQLKTIDYSCVKRMIMLK